LHKTEGVGFEPTSVRAAYTSSFQD